MYTVIIVDDDLPVLQFLQSSIRWEELGFELIGAYSDSSEALAAAQAEQPDVLISDIGMPGMNGIELIRELREQSGLTAMKAAILSCHDDFPFAQAAVKLAVSEYMLKETMDASNISELLKRLRTQLDAEAGALSKSRSLEREAQQNRGSSKRQFIRSTINEPLLNPAEWGRKAESFGIRLDKRAVIPAFGYANRGKEAADRYKSKDLFGHTVDNIVEEFLEKENETTLFSYDAGEIVILLPHYSQLHVNNSMKVEQTLRHVQSLLLHYAKVPFSFLIGQPAKEAGALKDQLARMTKPKDLRFFLPESSVIPLDHVKDTFADGDLLLGQYMPALDELRHVVFEERADLIDAYVSKWIDYIQYNRFRPLDVKEWLLKMILDIRLRLKSLQNYHSDYSTELLHHDVLELTNIRELERWLKDYLRQAIDWAGQVYRESHNREIIECQRYVYNHLDRKVSLEDAAAHLHLHPSYLSRLFKRETGENFVEYVTRLKMEKAKELLEMSDRTIEDIADMLGYDNKNYFGKLFKAHTGTLPSVYRSRSKA
ncbi:MAG: AraC family transcriptional regulator [Paenibacillus sp.]|nr:AraC family transcriptional regulator [Paenibacillus sp.]